MTKTQYRETTTNIQNDPAMVEVITKRKILDENGEQMVIDHIDQSSMIGTIHTVYAYAGGTADWRCVGTDTVLIYAGQTIRESDCEEDA